MAKLPRQTILALWTITLLANFLNLSHAQEDLAEQAERLLKGGLYADALPIIEQEFTGKEVGGRKMDRGLWNGSPEAHARMGFVLWKLNRLDEAKIHLEKAYPKWGAWNALRIGAEQRAVYADRVLNGLAAIAEAQNRPGDAQRYLAELKQLNGHMAPNAEIGLSARRQQMGDFHLETGRAVRLQGLARAERDYGERHPYVLRYLIPYGLSDLGLDPAGAEYAEVRASLMQGEEILKNPSQRMPAMESSQWVRLAAAYRNLGLEQDARRCLQAQRKLVEGYLDAPLDDPIVKSLRLDLAKEDYRRRNFERAKSRLLQGLEAIEVRVAEHRNKVEDLNVPLWKMDTEKNQMAAAQYQSISFHVPLAQVEKALGNFEAARKHGLAALERSRGWFVHDRYLFNRNHGIGYDVAIIQDGFVTAQAALIHKGFDSAYSFGLTKLFQSRPDLAEDGTKYRAIQLLSLKSDLALGEQNYTRGLTPMREEAMMMLKDISGSDAYLSMLQSLLEISVSDIQKVLPPGTALIDFVRYTVDEDGLEEGRHYACAITRGEGEPIHVELGTATELEQLIARWRRAITRYRFQTGNEVESLSQDLYAALIAPLEPHLEGLKRLYMCPDGDLNFIPFGVITDASGSPLSQRYQVRYVDSGRTLLEAPRKLSNAGKAALLIGAPEFQKSPGIAAPEIAANRMAIRLEGLSFSPLPGTRQEVSLLSDLFSSRSGWRLTAMTGEEASEPNIMGSMAGNRVVHIATHGFFLPELLLSSDTTAAASSSANQETSDTERQIRDPMYRGGLALAGASDTLDAWRTGNVPEPSTDGILMAAELIPHDLSEVELLVLSACDTGIGESGRGATSSGVQGLRHALSAAGVQNLVLTLWPIDDAATVQFMVDFYQQVLDGTDPPVALEEVQLKHFQRIREEGSLGEAIYLAAPFVMTVRNPAQD